MLQAVSSVVVAILTIYIFWFEYRWELFGETLFWILVLWWAYISLMLFLTKWEEAKERTSDEKVDDLITTVNILIKEIQQDRNERKHSK